MVSFMRNNVWLFFCCKRLFLCYLVVVESETTYGCFGFCCKSNKASNVVEYCKKEIISDKKHSARTERRVNIGKKNYTSV